MEAQAQSDDELVALASAGDKEAFGELAERFFSMAVRIAFGMVNDGWLAEELAQEAILQAYLSLDRLRDDSRFRN